MSKNIITVTLDHNILNELDELNLEEAVKLIKSTMQEYGEMFNIRLSLDTQDDYNGEYKVLRVIGDRLENDHEYAIRVRKEKEQEERKVRHEKQLLKELQEKYKGKE